MIMQVTSVLEKIWFSFSYEVFIVYFSYVLSVWDRFVQ